MAGRHWLAWADDVRLSARVEGRLRSVPVLMPRVSLQRRAFCLVQLRVTSKLLPYRLVRSRPTCSSVSAAVCYDSPLVHASCGAVLTLLLLPVDPPKALYD